VFPDNRKPLDYRKYICEHGEVLAKGKEGSRIGCMRPAEKRTTTESIELYKQSLEGNNYSLQSIRAYLGDIGQFVKWLKTRRVDFDIPNRIARIDIVGVPVAGVQKTTICTFTVEVEEENEGLHPHLLWT
jgi:hypothetical protein